MKKNTIIAALGILVLVCLGVLFFQGKTEKTITGNGHVGFVSIPEVHAKTKLFNMFEQRIKEKQKEGEAEALKYEQKMRALHAEMTDLKTKKSPALAQKEKELKDLTNTAEKALSKTRDEINGFIEKINEKVEKLFSQTIQNILKEKGLDIVLSSSVGQYSVVVFAKDEFDITQCVIDGLDKLPQKELDAVFK